MNRIIAAMAAGALLLGACAGISTTPEGSPATPTVDETPTPQATPGETADPTAEPTASPSPAPTPGGRFEALQQDDVLVVVTDDLVIRSEPEVSNDSEIYDLVLQAGDYVWYRSGPVGGSGYEWIEGEVLEPGQPDGRRTGWIAIGDNDTDEAWLAIPPPEGEGWRLLGEGSGGFPYTIGVALDQDEYETEWATAEAAGTPPEVDFETELVVRFTHAVPSTCPEIDLYGVGYDADDRIVWSAASFPRPEGEEASSGPHTCTTDARPHAFVVAIDRDRLPSGEVAFRLERGWIACPDCGREDEQMTVELP